MFNAYHSAFIGARGVMALLGVGLTKFGSGQFLIDVFPQPEASKDRQRLASEKKWPFTVYHVIHFPYAPLKQEEVWQAFSRTVHVSNVPCWSGRAYQELQKLSDDGITRPRNAFLYTSTHWPLNDLLDDASADAFAELFGSRLHSTEQGFLLRLSCDVYGLFESLMVDIARDSRPMLLELEASRITKNPNAGDLAAYNVFVESETAALGEAVQ
jgi:hypothetical protein